MKLTHIGISQFRSIGPVPVMIDLTKRITVLVGQNDCGKSNVLRGIKHVCDLRPEGNATAPTDIDNHLRNPSLPPNAVISGTPDEGDSHQARDHSVFTVQCMVRAQLTRDLSSPEVNLLDQQQLHRLVAGLLRHNGYLADHQLASRRAELAQHIANQLRPGIPDLRIIPQYRRIEKADKYEIAGKGIVKLLASWQIPDVGQDHLEEKYHRIVNLLRELLKRPEAFLRVPQSEKDILVVDGNMRLPLESHGTGVHQLIILAIAVLSQDNVIFGIEEPEIHLHPLLQKRFMQFLLQETTNRYIITTHSPALIAPSDEVDVIHLKMIDGVTIPTRVDTDANTLAVLDDLGIQPSDLLQANSVIWVEGPSDRIYLNRWLELLDPALREGVDYSIMFYGGRLLSHLSMEREDDELEGFVKLLRINQRSAILMDSDRSDESDTINETKRRIQNECATNTLFAWVTEGREIENCLPFSAVNDALAEQGVPEAGFSLKPFERFEIRMKKACGSAFKASWAYENHKPTWAHRITKHMTREQIAGDLEARLGDLIRFIKSK